MIETTFLATSEKLWPELMSSFGGPFSSAAKFSAKNRSIAAVRRCEACLCHHRAVPADSQDVGFVFEPAAQAGQPLVAHQHQKDGLGHPGRRLRIETAWAILDGIATVGGQGLAKAHNDPLQGVGGEALDRIAVKAGDYGRRGL